MGFHLESMVQICDLQSGSFLNVSMLLILSELQTPLDLFFHMKNRAHCGHQDQHILDYLQNDMG